MRAAACEKLFTRGKGRSKQPHGAVAAEARPLCFHSEAVDLAPSGAVDLAPFNSLNVS
jgi:hypothetical protein